MRKIFLGFGILALFLTAAVFSASPAKAETVKNAIIEKIDHDEKTLEAVKSGTTYVVNATNAILRKGKSGSRTLTYSKFKTGDVINIEGSFDDENVTATKLRNLSFNNKRTATFYGVVESTTESTKTVRIETPSRDDQTIAVLSSTDIEDDDGEGKEFSDLKEDDKIIVRGKWRDKNNTITKTKWITILDPDVYEDLDD